MFDGIFKIAHAGEYYQAITEARVAAFAVWEVIDTVSYLDLSNFVTTI